MNIISPLVGKNLLLRTLRIEEVSPTYLAWISDMDVNRYLEIRFSAPASLVDLRSFVAATNDSDDTLLLGMFLREDARHIGNIKLGPIDRHHGTGDIGLLIGERSEWGKGHACEAIALLADYAFAHLSLAKITASCYAENEGSRRAFLKAGFVEEGRRVAQYMSCGKRLDAVMLGRVNPAIRYHTP